MAKDIDRENELNEIYEELENGGRSPKKIWGERILIVVLIVVMTGVLLFVGVKVVDRFGPKPKPAPLEVIPQATAQPEHTADPGMDPAVEAVG